MGVVLPVIITITIITIITTIIIIISTLYKKSGSADPQILRVDMAAAECHQDTRK